MHNCKTILFAEHLDYLDPVKVGGHQYAALFGKRGWQVLFFSNPLSPLNILFGKGKKRLKERIAIYKKGGVSVENVWTYVPLTILPHHNNVPLLNKRIFLDNYYKFTVPSIFSILKNRNIDKVDILWIDACNQIFWTDKIKHKKLIYRVYDNMLAYSNTSDALKTAHYDLMHRADIILITSKLLMEQPDYKPYNHKMLHCPNGVDLANFQRSDYHMPEEYKAVINKPVALYIGAIDEWFDFDLLYKIASTYPDIEFFIIGPQKVEVPAGHGGNVSFMGPRAYNDVPSYIRYCRFGIIPFKDTELVRYVNPIKMYEFFSLGKPVISYAWGELKQLRSPVLLAHDQQEFCEQIDKLELSINHGEIQELVDYARQNTWSARLDAIMNAIDIEEEGT